MYKTTLKRALDFFAAFFGLIITSPVLLVVIICLFITNGGSGIFFSQERPGKDGEIFRIIKFKTMNDDKDEVGELLPAFQRITRIGRFIRYLSLDELPQLLNVIKGDMSLIGPRPLLVDYLSLYSSKQSRRHEVRPGITGWAQVNGRNAISWSQKFEYDVWYVDNLSFWLDVKIIIMTIRKIIMRADINAGSGLTMPSFTGDN